MTTTPVSHLWAALSPKRRATTSSPCPLSRGAARALQPAQAATPRVICTASRLPIHSVQELPQALAQ